MSNTSFNSLLNLPPRGHRSTIHRRRRIATSPFLNRPAELPVRRSPPAAAAANYENTSNGIRTRYGRFALQPHQITVCRLFAKPTTPGLLLYYKVGSGKTLASIAAAEHVMRRNQGVRRVVVVVPASLRANYEKELRAAGVDASRYRVLSFQAVHNMNESRQRALGQGAILVVDEVQNMRNPKSKMYDSLLNVARPAFKRLLLSGTPIMNYPMDIGTVIGLIDPDRNVQRTVRVPSDSGNVANNGKPSWTYVFKGRYGQDASKNKEELDGMLRCTTLFYEPDAAMVRREYPTKTEHWVPVPMTMDQARQQFRMAVKDPGAITMEELFRGSINPAFLTKPREVNSRLNERHPKIDEVVRRVTDEHRRGGKCVVYSAYLHSGLHRIAQLLRAQGVEPVAVYEGATTPADKKRIVEDYNADRVRVLLISDAGKEGLDLKNTTQIHVMEPQWNEEKVAQIIGRGVRYQSHTRAPRHVDVYRYYATLPPASHDLARSVMQMGTMSVLLEYAADDILRQVTERKQAVNQAFLQRLVRISDENVRRCM